MDAYIQSDIKFHTPPGGSVPLNELTVKQYLPKDGQLTVVAEKGAKPHVIMGDNFRIQVGRKIAGNHPIALLTTADDIVVRYGKDEAYLPAGVYYVSVVADGKVTPLIQ